MEKLCFASFVFGSYQRFIPFYVYSIARTYPEAFIRIFHEGSLKPSVMTAIHYLRESGVRNLELLMLGDEFKVLDDYRMLGSGSKTMIRWLLGSKHYEGFDYVYIGDIDIMILPERVSLLDFHKKQMKALRLPFSNLARTNGAGESTKRLSGLHFLKTKEYFEKVDPIIDRIMRDASFRESYLKDLERNESFLFKLNRDAFENFNETQLTKVGRPWHGIHLGITRGNKALNTIDIERNSSLSLDVIGEYLSRYSQDPLYRKIQTKVFVVELQRILKRLSVPYPLSWKYLALKHETRSLFVKLRRRF